MCAHLTTSSPTLACLHTPSKQFSERLDQPDLRRLHLFPLQWHSYWTDKSSLSIRDYSGDDELILSCLCFDLIRWLGHSYALCSPRHWGRSQIHPIRNASHLPASNNLHLGSSPSVEWPLLETTSTPRHGRSSTFTGKIPLLSSINLQEKHRIWDDNWNRVPRRHVPAMLCMKGFIENTSGTVRTLGRNKPAVEAWKENVDESKPTWDTPTDIANAALSRSVIRTAQMIRIAPMTKVLRRWNFIWKTTSNVPRSGGRPATSPSALQTSSYKNIGKSAPDLIRTPTSKFPKLWLLASNLIRTHTPKLSNILMQESNLSETQNPKFSKMWMSASNSDRARTSTWWNSAPLWNRKSTFKLSRSRRPFRRESRRPPDWSRFQNWVIQGHPRLCFCASDQCFCGHWVVGRGGWFQQKRTFLGGAHRAGRWKKRGYGGGNSVARHAVPSWQQLIVWCSCGRRMQQLISRMLNHLYRNYHMKLM